jgi:hypothetical protein
VEYFLAVARSSERFVLQKCGVVISPWNYTYVLFGCMVIDCFLRFSRILLKRCVNFCQRLRSVAILELLRLGDFVV